MPLRSIVFLFVLSLSLSGPARAQQGGDKTSMSAQLLSNKIGVGEIGQLFVKIVNGDASLPQQIEAEGLEVVLLGQPSFSFTSINGRQSTELTYAYRVKGDKPGTFTIPAITATIRGQEYRTSPVEVAIVEFEPSELEQFATKPYFGKLEVAKTEFYVNEIVPFSASAYVKGRNTLSNVDRAHIEHDSIIFKPFHNVRIDGDEIGNTYFSSATVPSTLFAMKPGEHRVGPATLVVRSLDLTAFFRGNMTREISTNTVKVNVKPLPTNAPASFSGAVGDFEMSVKASATELAVGDPVSMEFTITGTGNFQTMTAPVFTVPPRGIWKSYDPGKELDEESASDGFSEGRVVFSRVIIPEAKVDTIPEFSFSFFDPATDQYVTRKSEPIPIRMTEEKTLAPVTSIEFEGENGNFPAASAPLASFDDVLHIRTDAPNWIGQASIGSVGFWFYAVQTVFSVAFCTILGFGIVSLVRRQKFHRAAAAPVLTFKQSVKHLPGMDSPKREFLQAVSISLMLWKKEHPSAPPEIRKIVDDLSDRCETILYSGMAVEEASFSRHEAAEMRSVLERLSRR